MSRIGIVPVVVLLVLASASLPAFGMGATATTDGTVDTQTEATPIDDTNGSAETAPGTRLAGVVGVQGAELGGELESRSLDHQLNSSATNDSKAAVLARQTNQSERRLAALRTGLERLEAARENGSISESAYRVRAAQLSARVAAVQRVTNHSSATARTLPEESLRRNGVNVTALQSLRSEASELTGPDVAAIARELAGPAVGTGFDPARDDDQRRGPPTGAPGRADDRRPTAESGPPAASNGSARHTDEPSGARSDNRGNSTTEHPTRGGTANETTGQNQGRGVSRGNSPNDLTTTGERRSEAMERTRRMIA